MSEFREIPQNEWGKNNTFDFSGFEGFEFQSDDMPDISEHDTENETPEDPVAKLIRVADEQKINFLHSEVLTAASDDSYDFGECECNTAPGISRVVAVAGKILREDPEAKLTDKPIELPPDQTDVTEQVALDTLASMINGSLGQASEEEMSKYRVERSRTKALDACSLAEQFFAATFKQMENPTATLEYHATPFGYRIITDNSTPVAITKGNGVPTSVTLQPVTVGEVTYPPGSLFNFQLLDDYRATFKSLEYTPPPIYEQTRHDFGHIIKAGFIRLSNFANQPDTLGELRLIAEEAATIAKEPKLPLIPKWLRNIKNF